MGVPRLERSRELGEGDALEPGRFAAQARAVGVGGVQDGEEDLGRQVGDGWESPRSSEAESGGGSATRRATKDVIASTWRR